MRILLALTTAIICFFIGTAISQSKKVRVSQLAKLLSMLEEMRAVISFNAPTIRGILNSLSERTDFSDFGFLCEVKAEYEKNPDIHRAWRSAALQAEGFSEKDRRLLIGIGEQLGTTDVHGQLLMLEAAEKSAQNCLDEARSDYSSRGGMIQKTWTLCGIAVGILLL